MFTLQTSFKPLLLKGEGVKSVVEVTVNTEEQGGKPKVKYGVISPKFI
jgi:hypothetical protein